MKRRSFITGVILCWLLRLNGQESSAHIPHLVKNGNYTQLVVDNKPFLVLGGELGNSSASSSKYMEAVWPKLNQMNLNTVFASVYWELMEPTEGRFDFSLVDSLIKNARLNKMRLVLLWFGAWKNSMSCYAPGWVKTNTERFPRATDKNNVQQEILTPFNKNNLEADKKAFVTLMRHIRQIDEKQNTVIAIQVENEIGMLPDARTYDEAANEAFHQPVPEQLLGYLQKNKTNLTPHVDSLWQVNGYKTSGTWEEVFGRSLFTDEIFMTWHYARFVNEISVAGKAIYDLPMYVNAALNRRGWQPGQYPSAGPLPHIMDIWKAGAPSIDLFAPDIYFPDLKHWCNQYTRSSNPLFIPEIRFDSGIDAKAFFVFGNYNCLSFSPFSIESTEHPEKEPIGKAYDVLKQVTHLITKYQTSNAVRGFLLSKDSVQDTASLGNYRLTVKHDYTLGWSPDAKNDTWPLTGCVIISVGTGEFYVAGTGIVITFTPTIANKKAGFLSIDEGRFQDEKWIPGRRMNGDQDHQGRHLRIPVGDYSIQHVKLYNY
jgi:beta-galactosidase GanA